jgi:hypothetical protein
MPKNVSEIPYTSISSGMEDDSTRGSGSKDLYPRTIRGYTDESLVEYDESNRSTYSSYNILNVNKSLEQLTKLSRYDNDSLDAIRIISVNSDHIKIKGGDNEIVDVEIENGGSGYSNGTLTAESLGTKFLANYTVDSSGAIENIDIVHHGAGYTDEPTITISDSSGSNASLKAILGTLSNTNLEQGAQLNLSIRSDVIGNALIKSDAGIDATKLHDGSITNTELGYINTLSSNAQTQLNAKLPLAGGTMTGDISHAGDFALDVAGSIELNADTMTTGNGIKFKDNLTKFADFQVHHSATWLYLYENGGVSNDDSFGIECLANGATTMHTVDTAAAAAHLTLKVDGDIALDSETGNFIAKKSGTEFSIANSAYAGMIVGYTCIRNVTATSGHDTITIGTSFATLQTAQGTDVSIVFKAPPSGSVEIAFSAGVYGSSKAINLALSDNSTYNEINQIHTYDNNTWKSDETDRDVLDVRFVVTGLTAGTSYTYYIGAKASGASAYIYQGSTRSNLYSPPIIVKATALPGTITTGE